jgi:hypothetical protein
MSAAPRVTIAGGGLAGLTAALRLAERGYRVKVYEQKSMFGGNLGSRTIGGDIDLDIYPHMYLSWYHNFWRLLSDVSQVDRSELFHALDAVKQLRRGEFPRFTAIRDMHDEWRTLQNLFSGVVPPADMIVFGYAAIDMLAERWAPTMLRDTVSVGAFLDSRPYMTRRAARAFNSFITNVWAIPSYQVSADDYNTYQRYGLANPKPALWLARGPASRQVIAPLVDALRRAGVELVPSVRLTKVVCRGGRAAQIELQSTRLEERTGNWVGTGRRSREDVDELILAVPAPALSRLVRAGHDGERLVEQSERLAELSRLRTQRIPILHVYFRRKLREIPPEPVGLYDSRLAIAFTDISQTWSETVDFGGGTVLAVSSSDPLALPDTGARDDAMAILDELSRYLDFSVGTDWGDSDDIDWERTRMDTNVDSQLYLNDAGTDVCRPGAGCEGVPNVTFAGDFCQNEIGMTTIESAVTTGLEAASSIVQRRSFGEPIEITYPRGRPELLYVWMRYALMPHVAAASAWSRGSDLVARLIERVRGR